MLFFPVKVIAVQTNTDYEHTTNDKNNEPDAHRRFTFFRFGILDSQGDFWRAYARRLRIFSGLVNDENVDCVIAFFAWVFCWIIEFDREIVAIARQIRQLEMVLEI